MAAQDYDTLHYPSFTHPETHPSFLNTLGHLLGQSPAPLKKATIVEIGTSNGSNLIPMATVWPQTTFIGVDPAVGRINEGLKLIKSAGLKNIHLMAMGVEDLNIEERSIDYILVHGVMGWVSNDIQDVILDFIQRSLSFNGMAYISYNTRPGWNDLMAVSAYLRGMNQGKNPDEWCNNAEKLLKSLMKNRRVDEGSLNSALQEALQTLQGPERSYFFHEFGGMNHEAWYFQDMAKRASLKGLTWVGEAGLFDCLTPDDTWFSKDESPSSVDVIRQQQHLDFVNHRHFRKSIFMRSQGKLPPFSGIKPERIPGLLIGADIRPTTPGVDVFSKTPACFRKRDGRIITEGRPLLKAAYLTLAERFPTLLDFDSLLKESRHRLKTMAHPNTKRDHKTLSSALLHGFIQGDVFLQAEAPRISTVPDSAPLLNPYAHLLAKNGQHTLVDAFHRRHIVDDNTRKIATFLDGKTRISTLQTMGLVPPVMLPDGCPMEIGTNGLKCLVDYFSKVGLLYPKPDKTQAF